MQLKGASSALSEVNFVAPGVAISHFDPVYWLIGLILEAEPSSHGLFSKATLTNCCLIDHKGLDLRELGVYTSIDNCKHIV